MRTNLGPNRQEAKALAQTLCDELHHDVASARALAVLGETAGELLDRLLSEHREGKIQNGTIQDLYACAHFFHDQMVTSAERLVRWQEAADLISVALHKPKDGAR